jgi:hypothetical protein
MKRFIFVALVLVLALPSACTHAQDTGIDLQHECQAVLATDRTTEQSIQASHCLGYISGAAFSISMWQGFNKGKSRGLEDVPACLPEKGTNEEYIKVVLRYLDKNPNRLHVSYGVLVFLAFNDAYPCTAK